MEGDIKVKMAKFIEISEAKQEEICEDSEKVIALGLVAKQTNQLGDYLSYILALSALHDKKTQHLSDHVVFLSNLFNLALAKIASLENRIDERDGGIDESFGS